MAYGSFERLVIELVLRDYEETFQSLEHPQDTTLIDAFKFKFSYYPATYMDDSIKHRCAYLAGELRSYSGDWDELEAFYQGKMLIHDNVDEIHVGLFPIKLVSESSASTWFDINNTYSYSPFEVDALARLESRYYFWGFPKGLSEGGSDVYAVFTAPDCK